MPEPGQKFKLTRVERDEAAGRDVPQGIGNPADTNGYVKPGSVVTVREVVPAGEPGAHDTSEDAVVVEIEVHYVDEGENGEISVGTTQRAFSVGVTDFASWFEEVTV